MWYTSRTVWLSMQFGCGVANAYGMICALAGGRFLLASICAAGVVITARWKIPPTNDKKDKS